MAIDLGDEVLDEALLAQYPAEGPGAAFLDIPFLRDVADGGAQIVSRSVAVELGQRLVGAEQLPVGGRAVDAFVEIVDQVAVVFLLLVVAAMEHPEMHRRAQRRQERHARRQQPQAADAALPEGCKEMQHG